MNKSFLLAIDQGTTSTRAIVFDQHGVAVSSSQETFPQIFPENGWVEHNPEDIWRDTVKVCRDALFIEQIKASQIAAIGITNQRETTVVWEKTSGKVICNALVWQDRRTADVCKQLKNAGLEPVVQKKTGLLIDPYFSATKIQWILDNTPGAREDAEKGELLFGTIDCFLLWRLTGGKVHATDVTNASRTLLFNIHTEEWDDELLKIFKIPKRMLPNVKDSSGMFGVTEKDLFGAEIPITGIAGDQQAATIGQACFEPGMVKSTYGTGCFMMLNTGDKPIVSKNRLLTTIAYRIHGKTVYALEGSIFVAGAGVQWLRDKIKVVKNSADTTRIAQAAKSTNGVYFVPAFTGLGAPYWDPDARAAIIGMTRDTGIEHIVRALLEAIGYQTLDLMNAMHADGAEQFTTLRIDGGMVKNDWLCEFLADILDLPVQRPREIETTALGVAFLAGLEVGIFKSLSEIAKTWQAKSTFHATMKSEVREKLYAGWKDAVKRVRS
ncbi:MAG: glycerol kinase GlpK [Gammaproteobacteria bacterium]|nr:glycerol kinase GlpK [Gammaproteobacteria bacterium]